MAASEVNQLVEKHLSLVQAIARKVKKTLNASIELDDLVGYGSKGLVEAAERFDARHGVAFTTFAAFFEPSDFVKMSLMPADSKTERTVLPAMMPVPGEAGRRRIFAPP
jgi:hypothetical protein